MRAIIFFSLVICLLSASLALAQERPEDEALAAKGWRVLSFDGQAQNRFLLHESGKIEIETENSVSVLYKKIDVDLETTPRLQWAWKVDKPIPATDLTKRGQDDRSLALYVSFPFDEERAGFWERFIRSIVVAFKGEDTPGRVLSYVWGGDVPSGTVLESPYLKSAGALIALKGAGDATGTWHHEAVNIAQDYERVFGVPANQPYQIAISADSDDSGANGRGYVRDIRFVK